VELDDPLCYCFHISKRKIVNYIRVHRPKRASQLTDCGGAGTGCGWCIPFLKRCFEDGTSAGELSREDYAAQRAAYILAGKGRAAPGAIPLPSNSVPETHQVPEALQPPGSATAEPPP
jgi:bacterioferritin-associated ferredoxin